MGSTKVRRGMVKRYIKIFGTLGLLLLPASQAMAVAGFSDEVLTIEYAWTSGIKGRDPVDRLSKPIASAPLTFWVKVVGDEKALKRLTNEGMPFRHVWYFLGGADAVAFGDSLATDEISLPVAKSHALVQHLSNEVEQAGQFDWRSWSRKQNLRPGKWAVRVLYANGTRVRCLKDGHLIDDCMITIKVGR